MMTDTEPCPCQSGKTYAACCAPFHEGAKPASAEELMRSRYSAYVLQKTDYLVATTVPAQRHLLDVSGMAAWSRSAEWLGLDILAHIPKIGGHHAQVEFVAHFRENGGICRHRERSVFVNIGGSWYFIDPTVPLPAMKQACICDSGKKFKACCGRFFR